MLGRLVLVGAGAAAGAIATWKLAVEPWYHEWGVVEGDADRTLPGDDIVAATITDTRSIEIGAPPEAVWPWLVQMGFGRAGWYSYDQMDMAGNSIRRIEPDWQSLAVGDIVPTHPTGGFVVKAIDPGRSLVLYLDGAMVAEQAKAAEAAKASFVQAEGSEASTVAGEAKAAAADAMPANLKATGAVLSTGLPADFAASWAFALEPLPGGRTRFVERFRLHVPEGQPMSTMAGPFMGFGIFLMTRKQMLGIRERAEAGAAVGQPVMTAGAVKAATEPTPEPASA